MVIWKFVLDSGRNTVILAPIGAKVLSFQMQDDLPVAWMQVDEAKHQRVYHVELVATGESFADIGEYIGTVQDGNLVWHGFIKGGTV